MMKDPEIQEISCGGGHTLMLTKKGDLICFGDNADGKEERHY